MTGTLTARLNAALFNARLRAVTKVAAVLAFVAMVSAKCGGEWHDPYNY